MNANKVNYAYIKTIKYTTRHSKFNFALIDINRKKSITLLKSLTPTSIMDAAVI